MDVMRKWKAPIMMASPGWTEEKLQEWKIRRSDESTIEFYQMVTGQKLDHLLGIFCGHVHFPHKDEFRHNRYQFVTTPGFMGGYKLIRILPM